MSLRIPKFAKVRSPALLGGLIFLFGLATPVVAIATPGEIVQFPLPGGSEPEGITAGPDGNLWFTERGAPDKIGRITTSGEISEFPLPTTPESRPFGITAGPDGNLWFTAEHEIGRITPAGQITEYPVSGSSWGITAGPDGNVWFTATGEIGTIGRVSPEGKITTFSFPSVEPRAITAGPDGDLWVAEVRLVGEELGYGQIARITPSGQATNFRIPTPNGSVFPTGIASGPDGNLWFVGNGIGRIQTSGLITAFNSPVPGEQLSIAAGPEGDLWFGTSGVFASDGSIGRVTPDGHVTLFPVKYGAHGVTVGPDGNIWFTEWVGGSIGRIIPGMPGIEIASSTAGVHGRRTRLTIACSGGNPGTSCRGVVSLIAQVRRRSQSKPHRPRVVTVPLGSARYLLASERTGVVGLGLTRRAFTLLNRHPMLRVKAVARATRGEGASRRLLLRR